MNRNEFEKTLNTPLEYWASKTEAEVSDLLTSSVGNMVGFDQHNPHHCYNLFDHTLHTVDAIPFFKDNISESTLTLLKVAAYFHDLGKPVVAKEKEGRLVFYKHPDYSVKLCKPILKQLGYSKQEQQLICFWIRHHDDFIPFKMHSELQFKTFIGDTEITPHNITRHCNKYHNQVSSLALPEREIWLALFSLCYADASSQAEEVIQNDTLVATKESKCKKISMIRDYYLSLN